MLNGDRFLKKKIRYRDGVIISKYNDNELIFKNNNGYSVISLPKKELIVWKLCKSNEQKYLNKFVLVKLKIQKNSKRLLFIDDNTDMFLSRSENALVLDIYSLEDDTIIREAWAYLTPFDKSEKIIFRVGETVNSYNFDENINNINGGGIYYNLNYDDAKNLVKYNLI